MFVIKLNKAVITHGVNPLEEVVEMVLQVLDPNYFNVEFLTAERRRKFVLIKVGGEKGSHQFSPQVDSRGNQ
jgi:hypothetical protein